MRDAGNPRRARPASWLRRFGIIGALSVLGCNPPTGPYDLERADLEGAWEFRSLGPPDWCPEHGPTFRLEIREANPAGYGRVNLHGTWEIRKWIDPNLPIAPYGGFIGSADETTGEFEVLLWQHQQQKGVMKGSFRTGGRAEGALSWGYCLPKVGGRTADDQG